MQSNGCLDSALRLLSRKRFSRGQLIESLSARGFSATEVQAAVDKCLQWGYLNDGDYAHSVVQKLERKGFGLGYIRRVLNTKNLDSRIIADALQATASEENQLECCRCAFAKKAKVLPATADSLQQRKKLYRFLLHRGFSTDVIFRVMEEFFESPQDR